MCLLEVPSVIFSGLFHSRHSQTVLLGISGIHPPKKRQTALDVIWGHVDLQVHVHKLCMLVLSVH